MRQNILPLLLSGCILISTAYCQNNGNSSKPTGNNNQIDIGVDLSFGDFAKTHPFGVGIQYDWSKGRYGRMDQKPANPVGFTANAGYCYYFGKKADIGVYPYNTTYTYDGLSIIHVYGGLIDNPCNRGNIGLTAGPLYGTSGSSHDWGFGVQLAGSYFVSNQVAVRPDLNYYKLGSNKGYWAAGISIGLEFHY